MLCLWLLGWVAKCWQIYSFQHAHKIINTGRELPFLYDWAKRGSSLHSGWAFWMALSVVQAKEWGKFSYYIILCSRMSINCIYFSFLSFVHFTFTWLSGGSFSRNSWYSWTCSRCSWRARTGKQFLIPHSCSWWHFPCLT